MLVGQFKMVTIVPGPKCNIRLAHLAIGSKSGPCPPASQSIQAVGKTVLGGRRETVGWGALHASCGFDQPGPEGPPKSKSIKVKVGG